MTVKAEGAGQNDSRTLKMNPALMHQLAPCGKMWVPLTSTSTLNRNREQYRLLMRMGSLASILTHHEVYVITRCKQDHSQFFYRKIMDARYAGLRSVSE